MSGIACKCNLYLSKMAKSASALRPQFSKVLKTPLKKVLKYVFKFYAA